VDNRTKSSDVCVQTILSCVKWLFFNEKTRSLYQSYAMHNITELSCNKILTKIFLHSFFFVLKFIAWLHLGSSADEGSEFASCHHLRSTSLQLNRHKFVVSFSKPFQVPHTAVLISASWQVCVDIALTFTPLMHAVLVCCNM